MIEYPQETTDSTNDYFTFANAKMRNLVISNAGVAQALVKLTKFDSEAVAAGNADLAVDAGATMVIEDVSVQIVTGPTGQTIGVWRY